MPLRRRPHIEVGAQIAHRAPEAVEHRPAPREPVALQRAHRQPEALRRPLRVQILRLRHPAFLPRPSAGGPPGPFRAGLRHHRSAIRRTRGGRFFESKIDPSLEPTAAAPRRHKTTGADSAARRRLRPDAGRALETGEGMRRAGVAGAHDSPARNGAQAESGAGILAGVAAWRPRASGGGALSGAGHRREGR